MHTESLLFDNTIYFASVLLRKDYSKHNEAIALFHNFINTLPDKFDDSDT